MKNKAHGATDKVLDREFEEIDKSFDKIMKEQKQELENAKIKPIHDKLPFAQNGITGLIAPPGSGKTFTYLKLICQQEVLDKDPFFELVVICSTSSKFDKTVESFKEAIKKSKLVCVKDSDLLSWLNKYMRRILKYNSIINFINSGLKEKNEEIERIEMKHRFKNKNKEIEYLGKKLNKYNWKTYPHRCLLIFDDFASHPLIRSKETEMSRLLKKLRHFNINVMICVQTAKSLSKDIKRICTDFILFPGISEDDFMELMKESMAGKFNRKELWNEYHKMTNQHDSFRIHVYANKVLIVRSLEK